jgi:hypothetical protein
MISSESLPKSNGKLVNGQNEKIRGEGAALPNSPGTKKVCKSLAIDNDRKSGRRDTCMH